MALFEDPPVQRPKPHTLGEDLSALSLEEIELRIALLEAEIIRLREAHHSKSASRVAASAFFKS
ncbi:DUF1192 domain-containing protein [Kaistia algarum]|uniref:DUF1192 domain-containing protein n=1 Tax=Kaistia algarum TaxID=2083279 RepID=UPI000CE7F3CA|nr:DUF1192 domain-containing protein [Kaistia algarum]MCX5516374.1 DUF1192 domain-containing protein [Kaistia algarum]PPE78713.1 DUF1192 domain-containing protein [Kaistia algarum]